MDSFEKSNLYIPSFSSQFLSFPLPCSFQTSGFPEVLGRKLAGDSHLGVQYWSWDSAVLWIPYSCIACRIAGQELSPGHFPVSEASSHSIPRIKLSFADQSMNECPVCVNLQFFTGLRAMLSHNLAQHIKKNPHESQSSLFPCLFSTPFFLTEGAKLVLDQRITESYSGGAGTQDAEKCLCALFSRLVGFTQISLVISPLLFLLISKHNSRVTLWKAGSAYSAMGQEECV